MVILVVHVCCLSRLAAVNLIFFSGMLVVAAKIKSFQNREDEHQRVWKDGNIMLKGLFPITSQDGGKCERLDTTGLAWMLAMIYAVDKINNDTNILPNKTIGYEIENTCQSIPTTMRFAIQIVSKYRPNSVCRSPEDCCRDKNNYQPKHERISAVIGPAASWISIPVARLLGLYGIPQISYASTSRILGDKTRYKSFLRTVPSDDFQAQAMAEFVRNFKWNYVFLIASDDDYGKMGAAAFKVSAKNLNVCIANDVFIAFNSQNSDQQIEAALSKLKIAVRAKVVIVFSYLEQGERLLKQAEQMKINGRTWVTSDGWNSINSELSKLNVSKTMLKGLFSFSIRSKQVKEFDQFTRSLSFRDIENNTWFHQLLEKSLHCSSAPKNIVRSHPMAMAPCNLDAKLPLDHEIATDFVANVIDAVYVVAHAMHNIYNCTPRAQCPNTTLPISPETLLEFATAVDFQGVDHNRVNFDKNGERASSDYVIRNLQLSKGGSQIQYVDVGYWSKEGPDKSFSVNDSLIQWNSGKKPVSTCFRKCQPGEQVVGESECCWNCQKCDKGKVSFSPGSIRCTACNETHYANNNKTRCLLRTVAYLKFTDPGGIAIGTMSCFDILLVTAVAVVFIRKRQTAVIVDSSPHLLVLFFMTLYSSFIVTIIPVASKPSNTSCTTTSVMLLLIFFFYAAFFLAKTKSSTQLLKSVVSRFINMCESHLQFAEIGVLLFLQAILIIAWQATSPSVAHFQNQDNLRLLECLEAFAATQLIATAYPIVILALATFIAFRERHLPDNFNEAKLRSFSTLALCIVLVAFIPTYYYVVRNNRIFVVAFTLFVAAFACMGCMFVPKLYIMYFRPETNVVPTNQESMGNNVTHLSSSVGQATASENNCSQGLGHVNYASSKENIPSKMSRKDEKAVDISASSTTNEGKDTMKSEQDEISSISEVVTYGVM